MCFGALIICIICRELYDSVCVFVYGEAVCLEPITSLPPYYCGKKVPFELELIGLMVSVGE